MQGKRGDEDAKHRETDNGQRKRLPPDMKEPWLKGHLEKTW